MINRSLSCLLLVAGLVGCSATETPPSMSTDGALKHERTDDRRLGDVPEWMAAAGTDDALICYLDAVEGGTPYGQGWQARQGDAVLLAGWAVEQGTSEQLPAVVRLRAISSTNPDVYFAALRSERPDVSAAPQFAGSPPSSAGLTATLLLDDVAPGEYEMAYVAGNAQHALACSLGPERVLRVQ